MGLLLDGKWHDQWYDTDSNEGRFERSKAQFRHWITPDGGAAPTGRSGFKAEPDRYHLYVSLACPWAHRTLIFRKLKGLEKMITISVVNPLMREHGWTFNPGDGVIADPLFESQYLYQIYLKAQPDYSGRVTVPLLWDKKLNTAVSNESADIIRMFNSAFDTVGALEGDYYPQALHSEINDLNTLIYERINNGVYLSGFATTQTAYEEAVLPLFDTLDQLENRLASRRFLTGNQVTEADWRLFTTLVRFDPVYHGHFKCNLRKLLEYPNLFGYLCDLYQQEGIAETINMVHIKTHYYASHTQINPTQIVPMGPVQDLTIYHGRETKFK